MTKAVRKALLVARHTFARGGGGDSGAVSAPATTLPIQEPLPAPTLVYQDLMPAGGGIIQPASAPSGGLPGFAGFGSLVPSQASLTQPFAGSMGSPNLGAPVPGVTSAAKGFTPQATQAFNYDVGKYVPKLIEPAKNPFVPAGQTDTAGAKGTYDPFAYYGTTAESGGTGGLGGNVGASSGMSAADVAGADYGGSPGGGSQGGGNGSEGGPGGMYAHGGAVDGYADGGLIQDEYPSHYMPGVGRQVMADGGETDSQLPEPATASMPSKRQAPFGVTPPQGAVPSPMSQATRNLTDPGQVTIKSMSDAFNKAISNHLSLSPGEKITNARQAAQNISEFLGSSKTGKMNALLTANGKLMKAAKSQSGKEPVTISDGRGVETLGLSLFPDFKEGQFRVCGNSDSCRDSCIGKKSNAYSMDPTQAADQIPLTRQDREGMSGKPRMSALARTHALMRDPESFAVYLHDLIDHEKIAAARRGNLLGVRLNTLSDIPPSVFAAIIKAHPDVAFYDYTKMNYDPIAPNHHYTYSSTGVSQPEIGVENPFQNWHKCRDRLDQGENVAMAFSHKSGEAFPRMIHDEETGRHYKVVSGDEHDFRPLDIQDEGKAGVIVALKNIAKDLGHETAAQKSNGFFVKHDPGFAKDKKGNFVKDENGDRIPQNLIYTIRAQQKKRNPLTVFKRSGQDV